MRCLRVTTFLSWNLLLYSCSHCPLLLSNLGFCFHTVKMWKLHSKCTLIKGYLYFEGPYLLTYDTVPLSNPFSTFWGIVLPTYSESSRIGPLRWGQSTPLKHWELLTLQHRITLHKTWTFSNPAVRNPCHKFIHIPHCLPLHLYPSPLIHQQCFFYCQIYSNWYTY